MATFVVLFRPHRKSIIINNYFIYWKDVKTQMQVVTNVLDMVVSPPVITIYPENQPRLDKIPGGREARCCSLQHHLQFSMATFRSAEQS